MSVSVLEDESYLVMHMTWDQRNKIAESGFEVIGLLS